MNPIVHWQLLSTDPAATESFFTGLFEWTASRDDSLQYRRLDTGQSDFDAGIWPVPPGQNSFAQFFVSVDDVPAAVERATKLGGNVIMPHQVLPDGDEMAILQDPAGMTFGVSKLAKKAP